MVLVTCPSHYIGYRLGYRIDRVGTHMYRVATHIPANLPNVADTTPFNPPPLTRPAHTNECRIEPRTQA
jgi:hypothetical protein